MYIHVTATCHEHDWIGTGLGILMLRIDLYWGGH